MGTQTMNGSRFRFGVFELDLRTGELRKNGTVTNLPPQPIKILILLMSHPGELVTREEIQVQIWGDGTFVDFEHGLNSAIKRIRTVLDDDAESPRYIETLPRRGYRFIAPLEKVNGASPSGIANVSPGAVLETSLTSGNVESPSAATAPRSPAMPETGTEISAPSQSKSLALWRLWAALAAIAILAGVLALWRSSPLPLPRVVGYRQLTEDGRAKGPVIVSEGQQVYFSEDSGNDQQTLATVSTEGGPTVMIPTSLKSPFLEGISPNGTELLVTDRSEYKDEYPLYVVPIVGRVPRRLGDAMGHCGGWLTDGKIVYAHDSSLFTVKRDGTEPRKLVTAPGRTWWPRSSPDGRVVRFAVEDHAGYSLWEVAADGGGLHPLLPGWNVPPSESGHEWTADRKYFLFTASHNGRSNIWAIREKTEFLQKVSLTPMQLTAGPIEFGYPFPVRDRRQLFAMGNVYRGEPERYDGKAQRFVPYFSGVPAVMMDFDKAGERIAFVSDHDWSLWRSKGDGSERVQLTFPPMRVVDPRWAPDGKRIAFAGQIPGQPMNIYVISPEGGIPQQVTTSVDDSSDPGWSVDGNVLIFASARQKRWNYGDVAKEDILGIQTLDLRTHKLSALPDSLGLYRPRWSPDGRYVAALSADNRRLMLYDFTIRKWAELAKLEVANPTWSHNGQYIFFQETPPHGEPAFFRINVSSRKLERVAASSLAGRVYTPWSGLTPDDSPLMIRDVSTHEVYALDWEAP